MPKTIDALLLKLTKAYPDMSALQPTTVKVGPRWTKTSQAGLLSKPATNTLGESEQLNGKVSAFALLDALTRSGALELAEASFHVVMVATHCFDKTLIETVVQDNVNPIEKVERSMLVMARAALHFADATVDDAVLPGAVVRKTSPELFDALLHDATRA